MSWQIWTDGSAATGNEPARGQRHPGGWAAVFESSNSDGFVRRGREQNTTNTRMELTAVIQALAVLDAGETVMIHCDCAAVFSAYERRSNHANAGRGKDADLWLLLMAQFDRMEHVRLRPIPKGGDPRHARAHAYAGTEAKAAAKGFPPDVTVLSRWERKEKTRHLRAHLRAQARRDAKKPYRPGHHYNCEPELCVVACPVWRDEHPMEVAESRQRGILAP